MPRETALDHMSGSQFEIAKVWDRDEMCGSVLGGLMGELISVRASVWAVAACLALAFVPVFCSPVTRLHELPGPMESPGRRGTSPIS